ncbi:MAG: transcription antitermination factor NusB [Thermoanaerobaculia bacterium]|nr:MAG: transcription antitermination factor NusB [Thermoanaerobaculia bacterium]
MAREMAVQMLYQADLAGSTVPEVTAAFDLVDFLRERAEDGEPASAVVAGEAPEAYSYACHLVEGARGRLEEIDELIRSHAENWRLERMPAVDRNILRLAVYEMLHETDIPKLVIVDEAVELAKRFGSEQSGRFVNGLLDGILRRHAFPGSLK